MLPLHYLNCLLAGCATGTGFRPQSTYLHQGYDDHCGRTGQYQKIRKGDILCSMLVSILPTQPFCRSPTFDGEVLVKPFKFTNDLDGFRRLLSILGSYEKDSLVIGLESTAHYGNNLIEFLVSKHYHLCIINPIQTSSMSKKTSVRRRPNPWTR